MLLGAIVRCYPASHFSPLYGVRAMALQSVGFGSTVASVDFALYRFEKVNFRIHLVL